MVSEDQLAFLRSIDTPTVCNLIEIVAPERRGAGYTASHLHCPFPDLPPMVGFAKTATIRARDPVSGPSYMQKRLDYLDYIAAAPRPSIVVIEDMDEPPGYGAFWGEVQTNVHKSLGCLGTVTNGSIRDLAAVAEGFQMLAGSIAPSHAYVLAQARPSCFWRQLHVYRRDRGSAAEASCRSILGRLGLD
jgi:regulator of RNase E activity RraA